MEFTFTDEQTMAAQALRELLDDVCAGADLRARDDGAADPRPARWERLVAMGLPGALAPEAAGGMALTATDFVLLAEEAGRAALPEPLVAHAGVAVPMLAELVAAGARDIVAQALEQATAGTICVIVADPLEPYVAGVDFAQRVLAGTGPEQIALCACDELSVSPQASLDPLQPLARVRVPDGCATLLPGRPALVRALWRRAQLRATTFAAAELLGLAARMVGIAVNYAGERRQFGRPIGSNQAIKHHLATVQVKIEFARPVVYAAAAMLADADAAPVEAPPPALTEARIAQAKLAAGDAADLAARTAIQVHGAIGYSWELDLQFYAKRAWALGVRHGERGALARRVQQLLLDGSIETGPDRLFAD